MRAGHFEISDSVFTPEELEFFAEEELITIVPKISTTECSDQGEPGYLPLLSGTPWMQIRQRRMLLDGSAGNCEASC
jgi:hypothetical protein